MRESERPPSTFQPDPSMLGGRQIHKSATLEEECDLNMILPLSVRSLKRVST